MKLSRIEVDTLKEVINIGVGKASSSLSAMLGMKITLNVPAMHLLESYEIDNELSYLNGINLSTVNMNFYGSFSGSIHLVYPQTSADRLVSAMTDESSFGDDFDSIKSGTLTEIANIVLNGILGSIGNILSDRMTYTVPQYLEAKIENLVKNNGVLKKDDAVIFLAETQFTIEKLETKGDILLFLELKSFKNLVKEIDALIEKNMGA
jgi:chemotaxis protein CheC